MKKVNVGIASFAHMHAFSYASVLASMDDVSLRGFWDPLDARARQVEASWKLARFDSWEGLVKEDSIDIVLVTSETVHHAAIAIAAMEAGKDVIIEKPIATTLEDAARIVAAEARLGRRVFQCYPCRYHPSSQHLKAMIDAGELGRVTSISATNHGCMPSREDPATRWFSDKALAGGGAVMDHTTHAADLIFWFTGYLPDRIFGTARTLFHDGLDVDDAGTVLLRFTSNAVASIDPSWSRPPTFPTWGDLTMLVHGEEATASIDMFNQNLDLHASHAGKTTTWLPFGSDIDAAMLAAYIGAFSSDAVPPVTARDGLAALKVAVRAYESAGRRDFVPW